MKNSHTCQICQSHDCFKLTKRWDDRYGYQGTFDLHKCVACAHVSLQASFSDDELRDLYSNYYPRSTFNLDDFRPYSEATGFAAWLDGAKSVAYAWVPKNVHVLDIGCGFGQSLAYHKARGCDVQGVEADENIRRVADKFGFDVYVGLFDAEVYAPATFDYITMNQVIEHVREPVEVLKGLAKILRPGGTAILTTPNAGGWCARVFGRFWINWHAPYHLQFFSRNSMRLAAERAGLRLAEAHTITNSEWLLYQWIHLMMYPQPGQPSSFWTPSRARTRMQAWLLRGFYILHRAKLNHLVTRLFDAFGCGDNHVFVLKKP